MHIDIGLLLLACLLHQQELAQKSRGAKASFKSSFPYLYKNINRRGGTTLPKWTIISTHDQTNSIDLQQEKAPYEGFGGPTKINVSLIN